MGDHQLRLQAFAKLGEFLREYYEYANKAVGKTDESNPLFTQLDEIVELAGHKNGWFTSENVLSALEKWGNLLNAQKLTAWMANYDLNGNRIKTCAIIMAGNIPLVGFHDFLTVLITGNRALIKLSSNDNVLLAFLADFLKGVEPTLENDIVFQEGRIAGFDAIIATGSNNTARYFDYYFKDKPSIIRRNRTSVAVLTGSETPETLRALGEDIFRFFGLGCRSVSKLFVPENYNFDVFFEAIYPYKDIINLQKYANNYDYNKAVYLMSEFQLLDNGFLMLKEDKNYGSPIATLFYEYYVSVTGLKDRLERDKDQLQCVVAANFLPDEVQFGQTQSPSLTDYADNIDTVEFLLKTSQN